MFLFISERRIKEIVERYTNGNYIASDIDLKIDELESRMYKAISKCTTGLFDTIENRFFSLLDEHIKNNLISRVNKELSDYIESLKREKERIIIEFEKKSLKLKAIEELLIENLKGYKNERN